MNEEELADFLSNTYDTNRITFKIYTYEGKHIKGKINFEKGILGYGFDLSIDRKTKEQIKKWIDRAIMNAFILDEE